jgi:aryl-alcohol dehydrogenase-like predicted oxidoreductase
LSLKSLAIPCAVTVAIGPVTGCRYGEHMKYLDVDGIGRVSRIGLGTWQFGSREWGYGDQYASGAARDIVQHALALGVTLFDTAEIYGKGKSERILGEALGDRRADVAVASKIFPVAPFPPVVKQRERASARRLQLDRIPLYQIHQPNPVVPDSVIMPGMRSLLDRGDIGATGVSNYSLARWQKADAALGRPVISNQVHFSLAHPRALDDLVPFAEREKRIVIAYSPLAQGLLGGKYGLDNRPGGIRALNPLFGTENLCRAEPLLQTLRDVAREAGAKPAQVALAWLISLPGVVAIPGASSVDQLEFNVAAADIELTAESRNALTDAARAFRPVPTSRKQILMGYRGLSLVAVELLADDVASSFQTLLGQLPRRQGAATFAL